MRGCLNSGPLLTGSQQYIIQCRQLNVQIMMVVRLRSMPIIDFSCAVETYRTPRLFRFLVVQNRLSSGRQKLAGD